MADRKEKPGNEGFFFPADCPVGISLYPADRWRRDYSISICIFPEGTRNSGEELSLLPFKEGSFKIAEKTGCAIVPISLNNTAEMFEAHFPKIKKTHVVIDYGAPVYPKDLDKETRKHLAPYFEQIIKETIQKNVEIV